MLFRRIQLREPRAQNPRLPIFASRGHLLLLHAVFYGPNLGAVIVRRIADEHHLEQRLVSRQVDFVVKLRGEGPQFLQYSDANGLQIRLGFIRIVLVLRVTSSDALEIAVQPDRIGISGKPPLRSTQQHGNVRRVDFQYTGRDTAGLHGLIDRGEYNVAIASDVNDDATAREVSYDLVFRRLHLCSSFCIHAQKRQNECNTDDQANRAPRIQVAIHYTYIVRPDAATSKPGINLSQHGTRPIDTDTGAASSFPPASTFSRIDAAKHRRW